MVCSAVEASLEVGPGRVVRMSGTPLAPRWRGRLHLGACIVAAPAAIALSWHEPDASVALYAAALVALYSLSAAYHLLPSKGGRRDLLRRADHAMIYLFIAASCTPFCVHLIGGAVGRVVLALVWAAAAIGVLIKVWAVSRWRRFGAALYLVQGWLAVATFPQAVIRLPAGEFGLVVVMGLLYTAGAAVLFMRRPDPVPHVFGYHEVWHAIVVLASACYFAVVWSLPSAGLH